MRSGQLKGGARSVGDQSGWTRGPTTTATFTIVATDGSDWGVAVPRGPQGGGNRAAVEAKIGAIAAQAKVNVGWRAEGIRLVKRGESALAVVEALVAGEAAARALEYARALAPLVPREESELLLELELFAASERLSPLDAVLAATALRPGPGLGGWGLRRGWQALPPRPRVSRVPQLSPGTGPGRPAPRAAPPKSRRIGEVAASEMRRREQPPRPGL